MYLTYLSVFCMHVYFILCQINSDGAAIQITEDTPLHVSINEDGDRKLCLGSRFEGYGNDPQENGQRNRQNGPTRPLHLNYTICTGENALETAELLADKDIWDGLKVIQQINDICF